jgi:hypothetical protein
MIKQKGNKHQYITYHRATAILHDTSFSIRKFISKCGVKLLVAMNSIFMVFHHEHFSVLLREGKDLHALLILHVNCNTFFTEHARSHCGSSFLVLFIFIS